MDTTLGRDFRLLWLGRSLSELGTFVIPAALAIAVVRATDSVAALGVVLTCAAVPRLVLLPLGGVVADRWSPRRVALTADLVRCLTQLVVGVELVVGVFRITDLAVAAAIAGIASAFALPTTNPLVAGTVRPADRPRANALLGVSYGVARVGGPALAGLLVLTVGPGWAFLLDAATFAVSALTLALVRLLPPAPATTTRPAMLRDLVEGWAELRRHPWLQVSLVGHACWNLALAVLLTLGPLIAVRDLGGEAVWVAMLQAGAVGLLGGSILATRLRTERYGRRLTVRVSRPVLLANLGLSLLAVPLVLLAVAAPAPAVVAGQALSLAALGFLNPVWETAVQQHVPADKLARVSAYDMLVSLAAMPLGYALAAPAAGLLGTATPLLLSAVLVVVTTAGTAAVPAVRRLGAPRHTRSDDRAEPART